MVSVLSSENMLPQKYLPWRNHIVNPVTNQTQVQKLSQLSPCVLNETIYLCIILLHIKLQGILFFHLSSRTSVWSPNFSSLRTYLNTWKISGFFIYNNHSIHSAFFFLGNKNRNNIHFTLHVGKQGYWIHLPGAIFLQYSCMKLISPLWKPWIDL